MILVVDGNHLVYEDNPASPSASIIETKLLIVSIISDAQQGAIFMNFDLKDLFLATPMIQHEYTSSNPKKYVPG